MKIMMQVIFHLQTVTGLKYLMFQKRNFPKYLMMRSDG